MPVSQNLNIEEVLDLSASHHQSTDANDEMILIGIFGAKAKEKCPVTNCEFESAWCNPAILCGISASGNISAVAPK